MSLLRKEREMGITPDPAVDAYLKANSLNALLPAGQPVQQVSFMYSSWRLIC